MADNKLADAITLVDSANNQTIIDQVGFTNTLAGINVQWSQIQTLEDVTSSFRPNTGTPNKLILNDTLEANDDYTAPLIISQLSAVPLGDAKLILKKDTGGAVFEEVDLTQNGVSYTTPAGATTTATWSDIIDLPANLVAVEPPPNSTTLQINNTLYLTDGVSNTATLDDNSLSFNDGTYTPSIGLVGTDYVIDGQGARVLINGGDNEFYIGQYSANTAPCIISGGNSGMFLNMNSRSGMANIGDCDYGFNQTKISLDDTAKTIKLETPLGQTIIGDPNGTGNSGTLTFDDFGNSFGVAFQSTANIILDCNTGSFSCGDINVVGNGTRIELNDPNSSLSLICGGNPVKLNSSASVQYSTNYYTTSQTITNIYPYSLTFDGVGLVAFLPVVSSVEVGIQFLITNVNSNVLSVIAQGSQLIYSSIAPSVVGNRNLNNGHSQLFTAIITGPSSYGWSMV